ncbi:MAG: radical SAM protein [Polyangiaceae bacterium]|nr:radical SAM protein [Polyangiaceae bacterium]MCW5789557.1 radical SAM protein [Polyangiaceae bacterium]
MVPLTGFLRARFTDRKFPLAVTLCLTNRCNFRCVYCHMPGTKRSELTTAEWLSAIDQFRAGGMIRCSLMGGEPLLRRDVGEIIQYLKQNGVHSAMNTNGWLVEDKLDDVAKLNLVCVGLDGPEAIHDEQRKRQGAFRRAVRAIELLLGRGVEVVTMSPVTPASIDHVDSMLTMAKEMGFRAGFQIEHDAECDVRNPIGAGLSDERLVELAEHLLRRRAEGAPIAVSKTFLETFAARGRRMVSSCSECRVPSYSCMVRPDGMVVPCFLTQHQGPMLSGASLGYLRAFHDIAHPKDAGCSSQPLMEMNYLFGLRPAAVMNALRLT